MRHDHCGTITGEQKVNMPFDEGVPDKDQPGADQPGCREDLMRRNLAGHER